MTTTLFPPVSSQAAHATRSRQLTLLACILGSGIAFLDGTLVNVALPAIGRDLGGGLAGQQWVVDGYLLSLGSLVLIGGSLGDLLGRRRVFAIGVAGFGLTSALCATSPTIEVLIALRLLQGVAGALLVPNSLAMIFDAFSEQERARAVGSWTSWTGVATVIGPLVGGAVVVSASWRWVFVLNVPAVLATLWLLKFAPPGERQRDVRIDWIGAALCAVGLGVGTFALIEEPSHGWASAQTWLPLAGGLVVLTLFLVRERLAAAPMMPLGLFRSRNFSVGNLSTLALYGAVPAATFFLVLFLQQVRGASALGAGAVLLPTTIMIFLFAKRFGALADRFGARLFMGIGPLVAAAGLAVLLTLQASGPYVPTVVVGTAVLGLGLSVSVAALTATVVGAVDQSHDGVASGINNAVARVGGLVAIAVIGAAVASRFSSTVHRALAGGGRAVQAAASHPLTVGVSHFPLAQRAHARTVLHLASIDSLRVGLAISAALAVIAGVVSLLGVRDRRSAVSAASAPGGAFCGASSEICNPSSRAPGPVAVSTIQSPSQDGSTAGLIA
jgi:EmrB/QacA subfamily drug resistance transporter